MYLLKEAAQFFVYLTLLLLGTLAPLAFLSPPPVEPTETQLAQLASGRLVPTLLPEGASQYHAALLVPSSLINYRVH
jgi:hypothetical protein